MSNNGATTEAWELAGALRSLPDEWLVEVLTEVFARRRPYPADGARYYLAVVDRERDERTGAWAGPAEHAAVAYADPAHVGGPGDVGPDWGLCQGGSCDSCGIELLSNRKHVRCPLCDAARYLT
jgi:hypothetical protein